MISPERDKSDHQHYRELCALSTSGDLTFEEQEELRIHLNDCRDCTQLMLEYGTVFVSGMTKLFYSSVKPLPPSGEADSVEKIRQAVLTRVSSEASSLSGSFWAKSFIHEPAFFYGTLAVILSISCTLGAYRWGVRKGRESSAISVASQVRLNELNVLADTRVQLNRRLQDQASRIEQLTSTQGQQVTEIDRLRRELVTANSKYAEISSREQRETSKGIALEMERAGLASSLEQASKMLQQVQDELASARAQHQQDSLRSASLEEQVTVLRVQEKEQSRTVADQRQYLASDRDVRELMGARNLYIVDVFDVDDRGRRQKPFGRIFYTKDKSLIFYAFDLDRQNGVQNAAFQAWGKKSTGHDHPLNMGVFYLDNEANKRWVLKFEDPEKLQEIDSVFVTVEPYGGSKKPSGRQLLYASLRTQANHP